MSHIENSVPKNLDDHFFFIKPISLYTQQIFNIKSAFSLVALKQHVMHGFKKLQQNPFLKNWELAI